jgi:subtilisin family serine protease
MTRRIGRSAVVVAAGLAALAVVGVGLAGSPSVTDGGSVATGVDTGSALVQLKGAPLSTDAKTKPPKGKKIDFSSGTVKSYRAQLNNLRNEFKRWLRDNAPAAKVTGEFDISLNAVAVQLNGTPLATLRAAPMVAGVQFQAVYAPQAHDDPDLALVHANEAWAGGKGSGVKVAIIDTGIDITHPCFSDGAPGNDGPFTNDRVVFADVFHNKADNQGFTPADENGHGTHVAGTVGCNEHTPAVLDGITVDYDPSGVAPEATLGNFNVFPDDVANARSEDIVNALEKAYSEGFDVANMSLSGGSSGADDLLSMAVDNLDQANMVSAVAAGNGGPGFSTVGSPGKAARALTAGAITVGHFIGVTVTDNDEAVDYAAAVGQFGPSAPVTGDLDVLTGAAQACAALPAGSLTNEIALIERGTCAFSVKIRNAQTAGAVGVIMRNNVPGPPVAMGQDGTPNQPTIPAVMVSQGTGVTLTTKGGNSFTIDDEQDYVYDPAGDNVLAGFSAHGPTDVDFRVKPDVVAPGVNVLSSQPPFACTTPPCWAFFQGTSMATPHLAGIAALVIDQHASWSAGEVRSAIVNTADQGIVNLAGFTAGGSVNSIGAGRANAESSVNADVALDPVSVSFGAVPSGSGRADTRLVSLSTLGTAATSVAVTNETCAGVNFGATLSGSTITVTMAANKGIPAGDCQGILRVFAGATEIAHAAVYALVK